DAARRGDPVLTGAGGAAGAAAVAQAPRLWLVQPQAGRLCYGHSPSTTRRTITRSFFSAAFAVAMISARFTGSSASGRHVSVTIDSPRHFSPQWTATITSGTVDMPTTSAPSWRRKRYSARVARFGPGTATNTPRCHGIFP